MMRLRRYLKNLVKIVRNSLTLAIFFSFLILSCKPITPSYTKENFAYSIKRICHEEFAIENVTAWLVGETAWIYTPQERLLNEERKFDEEVIKKINKVALSVSRVLLSMKPRPKFYVIVASDTKEVGADLINIGYVTDIVLFQFNYISRGEFGKRNVYDARLNPSALSDSEGKHIAPYDIKMEDFLSYQIFQRLESKLKESDVELKDLVCFFENGTFNLQYEKIESNAKGIDINHEALKLMASLIKTYRFSDYSFVKISNLESGQRTILGKLAFEQDFSSR